MADVYVNALTTIGTEPTTTDSMVAVNRNTNEGKIIDYNLLADAILNKLTSKQYSGLSTTSKLLVGAINELDSDVSSLNSRLEVKHVTYTGTTNSGGVIMGGLSDFGMTGGTRCIAAYLQRGSYRVFRKVDFGAYGNAGLFVVCSEGVGNTSLEPISNGDVTIDFYYI